MEAFPDTCLLFLLEHGTYYALLKLRVGMSALPLSQPWHSGSFGPGNSVVGLFHAREDAEQCAWPLPTRCRALSPPHPLPPWLGQPRVSQRSPGNKSTLIGEPLCQTLPKVETMSFAQLCPQAGRYNSRSPRIVCCRSEQKFLL